MEILEFIYARLTVTALLLVNLALEKECTELIWDLLRCLGGYELEIFSMVERCSFLLMMYRDQWKISCNISHLCNKCAGKRNFGTIDIDWNADPVSVKMQVRDMSGTAVSGVEVPLAMLQPGALDAQPLRPGEIRRHCTLEVNLPWTRKYLLAYSFFSSLLGMTSLQVLQSRYPLQSSLLLQWRDVCVLQL